MADQEVVPLMGLVLLGGAWAVTIFVVWLAMGRKHDAALRAEREKQEETAP